MQPLKRTKIVATLGPATSSPEKIEQLIAAGVNAFRLNFSHGSHDSHAELITWIKEIREKMGVPVVILQDLSGPKIRVGKIDDPGLSLKSGATLVLDSSIKSNDGYHVPVSYPRFAEDVKVGHNLLLADGSMEVEILEKKPPQVTCKVIVGGQLTSHKGINYPAGSFNIPALTEKDIVDLRFGLKQGIDYIALSFVKEAEDIQRAREICREEGVEVGVIAKIEKHEAVNNFFDILEAVDGIMVARGDLGVEIPLERVPLVQKKIIRVANLYGKPVITATQMLLSMVDSPRPTRAEASDITNAILDGTDAIMLSEETARGNYPVEAVETMQRIATETESQFPFYQRHLDSENIYINDIPQAISNGAVTLARNLEAKHIICPTSSGFTARMISRHRPAAWVLALTPAIDTYYRLALVWGVIPRVLEREQHMERLLENAIHLAKSEGFLETGSKYVITAGFPFGHESSTNLIKAGEVE